MYVVTLGYSPWRFGNIITVDKIDKLSIIKSFIKWSFKPFNAIPPHMRNFVLLLGRHKPLHIHIKDSQAVCVTFLAVSTHKLHSYTNPENRLSQRTNHFVQFLFSQISHGVRGFSLTRKQNTICLANNFGLISDDRRNT